MNKIEHGGGEAAVVVIAKEDRRSSPTTKRDSEVKMDFQRIELAGAVGSKEELEVDFKKLKQIKNWMKKTDWLFLNACVGVVEGDLAAIEA